MFIRLGLCCSARLLPVLLCLLIVSSSALARTKTDIVVMKNGDRITCEIKRLEHGQLVIKPPYSTTTLAVDWDEVGVIESEQLFQVNLTDGEVLNGTIQQEALPDPSRSAQSSIVESDERRTASLHDDVIAIEQLGGSFWQQLDFNIDFGFSFLKSNADLQSTLNTSLKRLSRPNLLQMSASSCVTRRSNAANTTNTNRHNAQVTFLRLRANSWLYGGLADFLRNNEQQLDLRTTVGVIFGKRLVAKPGHSWELYGGSEVAPNYPPRVTGRTRLANSLGGL